MDEWVSIQFDICGVIVKLSNNGIVNSYHEKAATKLKRKYFFDHISIIILKAGNLFYSTNTKKTLRGDFFTTQNYQNTFLNILPGVYNNRCLLLRLFGSYASRLFMGLFLANW